MGKKSNDGGFLSRFCIYFWNRWHSGTGDVPGIYVKNGKVKSVVACNARQTTSSNSL
jgi:hypothetical protein